MMSMKLIFSILCLNLISFSADLASGACLGTEVVSVSSGDICCDETTRWCRTDNTLFNQNISLGSDYSLLIAAAHGVISTLLAVNGSLKIDNGAYIDIYTYPIIVSGAMVEIGDNAEVHLGNGGYIQLLQRGACVSISPKASIVLEFNASYLEGTNYTVPIFESVGELCLVGNVTTLGVKSTRDMANPSGSPPVSWSTNSTCVSNSSILVAFIVSCPPTYVTTESYIANLTITPSTNGVPNTPSSPYLHRTTPTRLLPNNPNSRNSLAPGLSFETTRIIVVVVIGALLVIAVIVGLLFRYNKTLRKKAMPNHDREYFEKRMPPASPPIVSSINTGDMHLAVTGQHDIQQTPSPTFSNQLHQERYEQITGVADYSSTQQ